MNGSNEEGPGSGGARALRSAETVELDTLQRLVLLHNERLTLPLLRSQLQAWDLPTWGGRSKLTARLALAAGIRHPERTVELLRLCAAQSGAADENLAELLATFS